MQEVKNAKWGGPERRIAREEIDQLEIEIHQEKVSVWVDGASKFLADEKNQEALMNVIIKSLDKWVEVNRRRVLEKLGIYALGAIILTLLAALGWRGWTK